MRIIFDLRRVGLGNNGGSLTLIKSGNTLVEMGHDVYFADTMKNQHTWNPLLAKHIRVNNDNQLPDADAIIATGYNSVNSTVNAPNRCGKKYHYIRGWETWVMSEKQIVKQVLKAPTTKIVNSICLRNKLKSFNFKSIIIRPGYDLEDIYDKGLRGKKLILGGLQSQSKHDTIKRTDWIIRTYKQLKKKNDDLELWMFGNDKQRYNQVSKYFKRPTIEEKNFLYNNVSIWLAPAMLEGLHMPPAEAMMTGCPVISTTAPMSGTQDYVDHRETGLVSKNDITSFIECVELLCENHSMRKDMGVKSRQKIEKMGDRKTNMKRLLDFLNKGYV